MNFHFDGAVAEMYGVDGAVFISRLQFWIEKNAANDRHYHEGRYWTYNSLRAMEKLFPFWSRRQIERIVKNLKDKGVLLTANYARDSYDRTLFYALDESKLPISPFGGDLSPNGEMINEQLKTHIREEEDKANKPEISNKPQQLADRYNAICTNLPRVVRLTDKRRRAVRLIHDKGYTPEQLDEAFRRAQASSFCAGQNDRHWKADFDWLLNENNLVKVLEGKYNNPAAAKPPEKGGGRKWLK
ncbi:hypothetical protein GPK77_09055 [Butyricicoccus faecihominis]|nr:hypothetical protein [Butyricicoccus faecihominis]MBT9817855.1 hypothetical protein [Butyricicoccus faecihominis]